MQICALLHSPQFNGKEGAVEGFDAATGRDIVHVIGRSRPLCVKASNLVRSDDPLETDGTYLIQSCPHAPQDLCAN